MKILNIILIALLAIVPAIMAALGTDAARVGLVVFALVIALFFANLSRFKVFKLATLEARLSETTERIEEVSRNIPSPELLLEHDQDGKPMQGSVDRLRQAVEKGYPIKVKIHHPNKTTQVMDAQLLTVDHATVYASNTESISQQRNKEGDIVFQERLYHWYVIAGSNGHFHETRVYLDGTKRGEPEDERRHMVWYGVMPSQG